MGKTFGRIKVVGGKIVNWNGYLIEGPWSLLSKDVTISIVKPTYSIEQLIETPPYVQITFSFGTFEYPTQQGIGFVPFTPIHGLQ